ncbi:hypothetical protein [Edaphobacter modestus]|uniref:Uncharacterized protein n=1 Tax=Edaphobacter modestus TaxID=388466 RepID=A0A4Q7YS41_9BACT|nr:hypothetical protein [Edaphobacter modestus]RZU39781.1 hypothetical protein BDD14_1174 [Edaphobacter modestus]
MKLNLGYNLGDQEKKHHIDPQELAKIDPGRIQEEAVRTSTMVPVINQPNRFDPDE